MAIGVVQKEMVMTSTRSEPAAGGLATPALMRESQRARLRTARVGVVGGGSPHRTVAWPVVERIRASLAALGYRAEIVDAERADFVERIQEYDVAFVAHFGKTETGSIQAMLSALGIPYSGSSCRAVSIAADKVLSKMVFRANGLRTPDFMTIDAHQDLAEQAEAALRKLGDRIMVKPARADGSYGLSLATSVREICDGVTRASAFGPVFLEAFVEGKTLTAGVVGVDDSSIALPAHQVRFVDDKPFLDPVTLYQPGTSETLIPPQVSDEAAGQAAEFARRAHIAIGARGVSRSDLRVDAAETVWLLELNTMPAMSALSDLPIAADRAGLSFDDLAELILLSALDRPSYTR